MGTKTKKMKLVFHMLDQPDLDNGDEFLEQYWLDELAKKAMKVLEKEYNGIIVLNFEYEEEA